MGRRDTSIQVQAPAGTEEYAAILIAGVLCSCIINQPPQERAKDTSYNREGQKHSLLQDLRVQQSKGEDTYNLTCCKEIPFPLASHTPRSLPLAQVSRELDACCILY